MFISSDFLLFFFGFFPGTNITLSCLCCHYRLAFLLCGCQCKGRRTGEAYFFLGAPINRMFLVRPHLASFATALVREDNEFDIVAWLIIFYQEFQESTSSQPNIFQIKTNFCMCGDGKHTMEKILFFLDSFLILILKKYLLFFATHVELVVSSEPPV